MRARYRNRRPRRPLAGRPMKRSLQIVARFPARRRRASPARARRRDLPALPSLVAARRLRGLGPATSAPPRQRTAGRRGSVDRGHRRQRGLAALRRRRSGNARADRRRRWRSRSTTASSPAPRCAADQRQVEGYAPLLERARERQPRRRPGSGHEPRLLAHARRAPARHPGLDRARRRRRPLHHRARRRQPAPARAHGRALRALRPGRPRLRQARDALHRRAARAARRLARASRVEGTLAPGPASIPEHGPVSYHGVSYQAFSFAGKAFPERPRCASRCCCRCRAGSPAQAAPRSGSTSSTSSRSTCGRRFMLDARPSSAFVDSIASLTGGLSYVRAGSHQLAGQHGPGPRRLPDSGQLSYRGRSYAVTSFPAPGDAGRARVSADRR